MGMMIALLLAAANADALLKDARTLVKTNRAGEACPMLEESHKLEPALATLLSLADCYERTGRLIDAYQQFTEAAAWAERTRERQRLDEAKGRAAALKPKLSWLAINALLPVPGMTVRVLAVTLNPTGTTQLVPVEPGPVTLQVDAPDYESQAIQVSVEAKQTLTVVVPPLLPRSAAPPVFQTQTVQRASSSASINTGALATMAAGVAALAAGLGGLGWSYSTYAHLQAQQSGGSEQGSPTVTRDEFSTLKWVYPLSWVSVVVGAAAVAGGTAWLLVRPRAQGFSLMLVPSGPGALVRGTF
ncbi:MAG: carboxypeptidase regulatory-like domain-containing protein [Myxococcaceae bacterium]|nr:carboxypeptidase regulatory-like domain-containing protein [Myxococcaceae bacterium]